MLTVRLGVGTQASRHTVELPGRSRTQARHWRQWQSLRDDAASVQGVPVVADLRDCGSIGVAGPRAAAVGVARGVVTQLVAPAFAGRPDRWSRSSPRRPPRTGTG